jgi:excisionase family DNA binding protein
MTSHSLSRSGQSQAQVGLAQLQAAPPSLMADLKLSLGNLTVTLPPDLYPLLQDLLDKLAQGQSVTILASDTKLRTQEAADLLGISRPHLVYLLESGVLPFHKVGNQRRIRAYDLEQYRQQREQGLAALALLSEQAQELGMGYE